MTVQEFALDATGISRVQVSREIGPDGEQFHVLLNRSMLGTIAEEEAQLTGRVFPLPDGSTLKVQSVNSQVQVLRNGQALLPTSAIPGAKLKLVLPPKTMGRFRTACGGVFLIGGVNVLLGIVFALSQSQGLAQQVPPAGLIIVGGVFLVLGFFAARKSSVALGIAITIYGLDGLLSLFQGNLTGIAFHIVLLIWMARGLGAIGAIRDAEAVAQS
jgi:hypothetical protein